MAQEEKYRDLYAVAILFEEVFSSISLKNSYLAFLPASSVPIFSCFEIFSIAPATAFISALNSFASAFTLVFIVPLAIFTAFL